MAKRLNNLLCGQPAALRRALHLDLPVTILQQFYANWRKFWRTIRQLSGDDAYERYLAHHATCHAETALLSCKEFFQRRQQQQWNGIKRCC